LALNLQLWKYLLTTSLPVGGATIVRMVAQQVDVIILSWLTDPRAVGLFSGPYRITMALRFIPQAMAIPLYPVYSRLARSPGSREEFQAAYERGVKFFLLAGFPVATVFLVTSSKLITSVLGARYQAAAPAMQLLGLAFLPFFVSSPLIFVLTAANQSRFLFISSTLSLALRVVLDFSLIPSCGFFGPCIAFLVSEAITVAIWIYGLWCRGIGVNIAKILWRPLLASLCMGAVLFLFRNRSWLFLAPGVLASAFIYGAALFELGAFSDADLRLIREGLGFVRPFLAKWLAQPQRRPT
jgi:O-antigen/teichoic acid export membrane protein